MFFFIPLFVVNSCEFDVLDGCVHPVMQRLGLLLETFE
jgi:hypothetical protein